MSKKLVIPLFDSEAEEAAWFDAHMGEVREEMRRQTKAGTAIIVEKGEILPKASRRNRTKRTKPAPRRVRFTRNDLRILWISLSAGIEKGAFHLARDKAAAADLRDRIEQGEL